MLRELRIRNLAVIEEVVVPLAPGLNVLTGETGAGKSIVVDAILLIIGARAQPDLIRSGEECAVVEALFEVARAKGYDCDYRSLRVPDLHAAQGIWLLSSVTLAARVHTLDGRRLSPSPLADEFAELVDSAIVSDR